MKSVFCKQFVYGKLTKSPEGSILPGRDHECTGKSALFPSEVEQHCQPSEIGPGIDDLTPWQQYKWTKNGGLACQAVVESQAWVVAGLARGRSESGENKPGRIYNLAHYMALPASLFDALLFHDMLGQLNAQAMQKKDFGLADIEIHPKDKPLEEGWFEKCTPVIRILMSGQSLSIQNSKIDLMEVKEFFQIILCSLPRCLQWRIGLRIGCWEMQGEVGLAHGQRAMSGVRMLKDKVKGHEASDLSNGDYYIDFLQRTVMGCQTLVELREAIDRSLPIAAQWDGMEIHRTWQDVASEVVQRIQEKDALNTLEKEISTSELPSPNIFIYYRLQALDMVLPVALEQGASFIAQTFTDEWLKSWKQLAGKEEYFLLASAFGFQEKLTAKTLERITILPIPEPLQPQVEDTLSSFISSDPMIDPLLWLPALTVNEAFQPWFKKWRKKEIYRLFWRALEWKSKEYPELFIAGENLAPWRLLRDIQQGRSFSEQEAKMLVQSALSRHDLDIFLRQIWTNNPAAGMQLLEWADEDLPFIQMLRSEQIYSWEQGAKSALKIWKTFSEPNELMLRIVLVFAHQLPQEVQDRIQADFESKVGSLVALAFWGSRNGKKGRYQKVAEKVLREKLVIDSAFESQALQFMMEEEDKISSAFGKWYLDCITSQNQQPKAQFGQLLWEIQQGTPPA